MRKIFFLFITSASLALFMVQPAFALSAVGQALEKYKGQENLSFSATRGEALWVKSNISKNDAKTRQCSSCHGKDLTQNGKHIKTGKVIKPMAVSVEPKRFTKLKKIEKWFKRNCKWTLGRECTAQEKGDVLTYLSQL